jgi:hypothetical protein
MTVNRAKTIKMVAGMLGGRTRINKASGKDSGF